MPELPEVETIKRDLEKNIVGQKIEKVDFLWPGILKDASLDEFEARVLGEQITGVKRRAKNLAVSLDSGDQLLFHMKMTGHLIVVTDEWSVDQAGRWVEKGDQKSPLLDPLNQYIRVIFWLSGGKKMAFSDLRKFAYVKIMSSEELGDFFDVYGPEPLSENFDVNYLARILNEKKTPIKKILMDQRSIAGIGNIYADEILYDAKIHPLKLGKDLSPDKIEAIYNSTKKILTAAVAARGTSVSDFRDTEGKKGEFESQLKVYRRTDLPCLADGTPIARIVVGGRGTHFCPKEQVL